MNSEKFLDCAAQAVDRRRELLHRLMVDKSEAFRLFGGSGEGIPGFVMDVFSRVGILSVQIEDCPLGEDTLAVLGEWYLESGLVDSVYLKKLGKDRFRETPGAELLNHIPLVGMEAPAKFLTREWDNSFVIRPYDGFQVGLFSDQRDNRNFLASRTQGRRVLNLFSYTCAFSVACARQGALTTSVDLSRKYLEWGKENFTANGIGLDAHRFFAADATEFLSRTSRRTERYDLVIIDPPSFARRSKGASFSLEKEFDSLIQDGLQALAPGGELFFSCNMARWAKSTLAEKVRALKKQTGPLKEIEVPGLAEDYRWSDHALHCVMLGK